MLSPHKPVQRPAARLPRTPVALSCLLAIAGCAGEVPEDLSDGRSESGGANRYEQAAQDSLDPLLMQLGVPILRDWITQSRDEAIAQGVSPIPQGVRSALTGYVPEDILDRARWRVGGGGELSLQSNSFYFGHALAITLDFVVVFRDADDAVENVEIWAHELWHVAQFRDWGVEGFAARYLRNHSELESEAARFRWGWVFRSPQ